jgi:hypothetical protein
MLNVCYKFVVFHIRPPDSSKPFPVNGIADRHALQLYLILEMAMTCVQFVPVLLLSEMFLSRDRLSFIIFTDNRSRKRQVSVRSGSQQGDTSGRLSPGQ